MAFDISDCTIDAFVAGTGTELYHKNGGQLKLKFKDIYTGVRLSFFFNILRYGSLVGTYNKKYKC